jgi:hypothetical protein
MTWFPTFLSPLAAAIAAAVAIPSLLVLYFLKLRRRDMPIASTLLWKKAIQDLQVNAPFQRLRRNLLLILQMLLLCLLILALARPVTFYQPGAGKNTVILIDRSASMSANDVNGKSRLEEAKRRAKDLVSTMERGGSAMVIAFDDKAETVQPFTTDTVALKNAIDSIKPTDRKTRLKLAYQLADAQLAFIPEQNRTNVPPPDVYVFSDGRVLDSGELNIKGTCATRRSAPTRPGTSRSSLYPPSGITSARRRCRSSHGWRISARKCRRRTSSCKSRRSIPPIPVGTSSKYAAWLRSHCSRTAGPTRNAATPRRRATSRATASKFTLDLTTAAVVRVEHKNKTADMLACDDVAQVVLPPPKALSVLLVTDGNYYLERALNSLGLKDPVTTLPTQYEQKQPQNYDVVIFDRYAPQKLPATGNFIYFGARPAGAEAQGGNRSGQAGDGHRHRRA